MLSAHQLSFEYEDQELFANLDFSLQSGEILQVCGTNGSGKTTLLRVLTGLLAPAQGEVQWEGKAIADCRSEYYANMQYSGHLVGIKMSLTVAENLRLALAMTGLKSMAMVDGVLEEVNLLSYKSRLVSELSAGQKRRLVLAKLVLTKVLLWILDEPFAALDKIAVKLLEKIICEHLQNGGMVVLTSHQPFVLANAPVKNLSLS